MSDQKYIERPSIDGANDTDPMHEIIRKSDKIIVQKPIVEICGDQMAAMMWQNVRDLLILPFIDI